jgi:D-alanyl-D-alanine carboxypeptidase
MGDTRYVEPTGLNSDNQSSAHDLALLVKHAYQHDLIRQLSTSRDYQVAIGKRQMLFHTTNALVRNPMWEIGLQKTGYIVEAGRCLTMLAKVGGHNLIMVLLDSGSNSTRLADAQHLRKWVVAQNGWEDAPVVAKAPAPAPRETVAARERPAKAEKVAAKDRPTKAEKLAAKDRPTKAEKLAAAKTHKARKAAKSERTDLAAAKKAPASKKKTAVAKKEGRVSKTYAARTEHKG